MSTLPCHKHHLTERDQAYYIEQETIAAAHPLHLPTHLRETGHSAHNVAMILVGERHAKHDLVELVGYLLHATMRMTDTLRRQSSAARMGMDAARRASTIQIDLAEKARAESSPEALASERAANAILTEENARLTRERDALEQVSRYADSVCGMLREGGWPGKAEALEERIRVAIAAKRQPSQIDHLMTIRPGALFDGADRPTPLLAGRA